jgi:ABC-type cobalamin/Fe3+-siderophores transport system ATPase subunit
MTNYKSLLDQSIGRRDALQSQKDAYLQKIDYLIERQKTIEIVQALVQKVAKETQEQLKFQIEDIVKTCIDTCFPDEYDFKVEFEIKRGKTECALKFYKNGHEIDDLLESGGGGVVDMASFGIRIAAWSLGNTANTLVLDEPFKFLSRNLQARGGEILSEISKKLGLQLIINTHIPELVEQSDKVFEVKLQKEGKWEVSEVSVMEE